jgi:integration host factor subunit alpha
MTLTKKNLIQNIQTLNGYTEAQSIGMVESVLELIKASLENGDDVLISGFGKFCVHEKDSRKGRNPATGDEMMLDPRRVVTFKCSGTLRCKLNGKGLAD